MTEKAQSKILSMVTDGFERLEPIVPRERLERSGTTGNVVTLDGKPREGSNDAGRGKIVAADRKIDAINIDECDTTALSRARIYPLRTAVAVVLKSEEFAAEPASGRDVASYHSITMDMDDADDDWRDAQDVIDNGIVIY